MAERGKSSGKPDLTPDALAPPAGEPPDTVPIYGILGESHIASSVRLYLDTGFSKYYDIPIEGIVKREKIPAESSPLGVDCTCLFVRKGIQLVIHYAESRSVEDEFLAGDFTAPGTFTPVEGAPGAAPAGGGFAGPIQHTLGFTCTYVPPCPVRTEYGCAQPAAQGLILSAVPCPSVQPCRTVPPFCRPVLSAPLRCPTLQLCPTRPPRCPILSAPPRCPTVQICPTRPGLCLPVSSLDECPTRFACPTLPGGCPPVSALDECPSRFCGNTAFGCESAFCGGPLGGGGDPGGF